MRNACGLWYKSIEHPSKLYFRLVYELLLVQLPDHFQCVGILEKLDALERGKRVVGSTDLSDIRCARPRPDNEAGATLKGPGGGEGTARGPRLQTANSSGSETPSTSDGKITPVLISFSFFKMEEKQFIFTLTTDKRNTSKVMEKWPTQQRGRAL